MTAFDQLTSPAAAALRDQAVVPVPLAAVEAHGPLGTDTLISPAVAALRNRVLVLVLLGAVEEVAQ